MMTSKQPYLLRAIHQWLLDNDMTPYLLVNAEVPNVEVPTQSVQDGQIVLNIAPHAVTNMQMDNEAVSFSARFSGVAQSLYIPVVAIRAIYASENGQGLVFPEEEIFQEELDADQEKLAESELPSQSTPKKAPPKKASPKKAPFLKVIK